MTLTAFLSVTSSLLASNSERGVGSSGRERGVNQCERERERERERDGGRGGF